MQQSVAELRVALRVLDAMNIGEQPNPQDVKELHRIAPPDVYESLDDIACIVIWRALDQLEQTRSAHG